MSQNHAANEGRPLTGYHKTLDFSTSPTLWDFLQSRAFVSIVRGSVGSGKSTVCCAKIMKSAMEQEPAPDGWRYTKAAVVRNTYGELATTTVATWRSIFDEEVFGPIRMGAPMTHHIRNEEGKIDLLVEFLALDKPKDIKKLLSWEGSIIWFNELREMPKQLVDAATARVGRYPSKASRGVECSYAAILGDTNPPDEDHWLHDLEMEWPDEWEFFAQPPSVLTLEEAQASGVAVEDREVIEASNEFFVVNPGAENLSNLPDRYYSRMLPGKDRDWIRVYAQGRYGFVSDGKPVTPEYRDDLMARDDLPVLEDRPLLLGLDIGAGTLAPAAVFGQLHQRGVWLIHHEVASLDMGLERFATQVKQEAAQMFPGRSIERAWADPAGNGRDEVFEVAAIDHMRRRTGIPTFAAPTNNITARIQAWRSPMSRLIDGQPGLLINRRCSGLRASLSGRWRFRRVEVSGAERYADKPEKNIYSHKPDAGGYMLLGGGEHRENKGQDRNRLRGGGARVAKHDFKIF